MRKLTSILVSFAIFCLCNTASLDAQEDGSGGRRAPAPSLRSRYTFPPLRPAEPGTQANTRPQNQPSGQQPPQQGTRGPATENRFQAPNAQQIQPRSDRTNAPAPIVSPESLRSGFSPNQYAPPGNPARPYTTQPYTTQPGITQPYTTQPNTTQPNTTRSGAPINSAPASGRPSDGNFRFPPLRPSRQQPVATTPSGSRAQQPRFPLTNPPLRPSAARSETPAGRPGPAAVGTPRPNVGQPYRYSIPNSNPQTPSTTPSTPEAAPPKPGVLHPAANHIAPTERPPHASRTGVGPVAPGKAQSPPVAAPADSNAGGLGSRSEIANIQAMFAPQSQVTAEAIRELRKRVTSTVEVGARDKQQYLARLDTALAALSKMQKYAKTVEEFRVEAAAAVARAETARARLSIPFPPAPQSSQKNISRLEREAPELTKFAGTKKRALARAETQLKDFVAKTSKLAKLKSSTVDRIDQVTNELKDLASLELKADVAMMVVEAKATLQSLRAQSTMLDAEQERAEAMEKLLALQVDLARREASHAESIAAKAHGALKSLQLTESQRLAAETKRILNQTHLAIRPFAEANAELALKRSRLTGKIAAATEQSKTYGESAESLRREFNEIIAKVEEAKMSPSVGAMLRKRRGQLPNLRQVQQAAAQNTTEIHRARVDSLEMQHERNSLVELNKATELAVQDAIPVGSSGRAQFDPAVLHERVRALLDVRRDMLAGAQRENDKYVSRLSELETHSNQLIQVIQEYQAFVDEHVLWSPSAERIGVDDLQSSQVAARSLLNSSEWKSMADSVIDNASNHPTYSMALFGACLALYFFRRRMLSRLKRSGEQASTSLSLAPTIEALLLTLGLASLVPAVMWCTGWWLNAGEAGLASSLAIALQTMAVGCLVGELFRQICRPDGLADKHFEWPESFNNAFYSRLRWLMYLALPTLFATSFFRVYDAGRWNESLGRLAFLSGLCLLACYLHFAMRPNRGALQIAFRDTVGGWFGRLRYVWYVLGVGLPLSFAILLAAGYAYTVDQLLVRVVISLGLIFAALLTQSLSSRALVVGWLRLAQIRRNLATMRGETADDDATGESEADNTERVSVQLKQFTRAAAVLALCIAGWFTWVGIAPAVHAMNVTLWTTTTTANFEVALANGVTELQPRNIEVPIRVSNALAAIIALMTTFAVAKTLPGLLEFAVVGRLPIDRGARHAILIISRYAATLIGLVVACRMIGMTWSSVQWLAAAMTVGLGFGLQEIFANLVSGLIILFERPIRIGDLVTVNGVTGRVTRMQIRATTITDFDRRELIVPNKKFITEDVVNWTLSDSITRMVIEVGVSYDSDPSTARDLLLQIAKDHPLVLDEPAPTSVFTSFGASTLDLELRAFLGSREEFSLLQNELNTEIQRQFGEQGLEIAFPQQDIRIRAIDPSIGQHVAEERRDQAVDKSDGNDDGLRKSA